MKPPLGAALAANAVVADWASDSALLQRVLMRLIVMPLKTKRC